MNNYGKFTPTNYGNFTPRKGDIVHVWGWGGDLFKVKKVEATVYLSSVYGWSTRAHLELLRLAKPEDAKEYSIRKAAQDKDKRSQKADEKAKLAAEDAELEALRAFCNADPLTHMEGELWQRVRALSAGALCRLLRPP